MQALGDIQIAVKALQEEEESLEHPVDKHYKTLHCALTPLDHEHDDFKVGVHVLVNLSTCLIHHYAVQLKLFVFSSTIHSVHASSLLIFSYFSLNYNNVSMLQCSR